MNPENDLRLPSRIDVYVHHIDDSQVLAALDALSTKLDQLSQKEEINMANVQKDIVSLTAQVAQNTSVEASAVTLINGIAAQLATAIASGNPAALDALQAQLATSASALSAAVVANTPAAPATPTTPTTPATPAARH